MKKAIALAGALALFAPAAFAADQAVQIDATVNGFCTIATTTGSAALVTLNLGSFGAGGIGPANAGTASMGAVVCNAASNVTLSSAKSALLVGTGVAAVPGLQNYISYNATTNNLPSAQAAFAATSTSGTVVAAAGAVAPQAGAFSASDITITVTPVANTSPLLAGAYQDTLTMTVVPQ